MHNSVGFRSFGDRLSIYRTLPISTAYLPGEVMTYVAGTTTSEDMK